MPIAAPPNAPESNAAQAHAQPVLVTGATGNVGRSVVQQLTEWEIPFVAAGSNRARVAAVAPGLDTRRLDFHDPGSYDGAVRGMRGLFLLRPPPIANVRETLNVLVDRAIAAGVEHVTFLSVMGAEHQPWIPHHKVERHLLGSGVTCTLLRAGFFAQNIGDAYRADIHERSEIFVPAGRGKAAFVDVRDIAELAARSFIDPALRGRAFTLTGPEPVSFDDVASALSDELGRSVRYRPASVLGYLRHLRQRQLPWGQAIVQTVLHLGLRFGNAKQVDPTLEKLLGRRPLTVRQYIHDHRSLWRPA